MLGRLDHVGYLVSDLAAAEAEFVETLGQPVVQRFERPVFSLFGIYLGEAGELELFTFIDHELLSSRLGDEHVRLDHIAYETHDIATAAASLAARGVRFTGADRREEVTEPFDFDGVLNLWTVPETSGGAALQILQRPG
jgi:catechol 2,3-dioxygenase-like lactoylglutathione lyase family enzyme